ncbi:hypothetical protein CEXT_745681 [Caerostris extrusa]|uniref:Uncharacterized protein n=1 Tax=Caerostris extrusa TaxID=172846 RepID=A0AAV4NRS4_CAEEX|nr:hypothetical protein CEXT_745681 [Caerostris extrusa]
MVKKKSRKCNQYTDISLSTVIFRTRKKYSMELLEDSILGKASFAAFSTANIQEWLCKWKLEKKGTIFLRINIFTLHSREAHKSSGASGESTAGPTQYRILYYT